MVDVAQSVELRIVIPVVVGSIPIVHPIFIESLTGGLRQAKIVETMKAVNMLQHMPCARVAELVDALDLGSSGATRESSSLSFRTILLALDGFSWDALF